jgi:Protein of unknown function (DUF4019)
LQSGEVTCSIHVIAQSEGAVKKLVGIILAGFVFIAVSAAADDTGQVAGVEADALSWLALTDHGDYAQRWDQAAGMFQSAISRENWINSIVNVRQPFGKMERGVQLNVVQHHSCRGSP